MGIQRGKYFRAVGFLIGFCRRAGGARGLESGIGGRGSVLSERAGAEPFAIPGCGQSFPGGHGLKALRDCFFREIGSIMRNPDNPFDLGIERLLGKKGKEVFG